MSEHSAALAPSELATTGTLATVNGDDRYNPSGLTALWLDMLGRRSVDTRKSYETALKRWLAYCANTDLHPFAARRADIDDWLLSLGNVSASTWNGRQAAVRSWYRYMKTNGATDVDPVGDIGRLKIERDTSNTAFLTADELGQLLDHLHSRADQQGTETAVRNAAVLTLMFSTGCRSAPVLIGPIEQVYFKGGHRVFGYRNKGGRLIEAPVVPLAGTWLDRYQEIRAARNGLRVDELSGRLFVSAPYRGKGGDKPLRSKDLIELIRRSADAAGIAGFERLVSHSTRHTAITSLLDAGVPLQEVQYLVGHADPRTTELYHHGKNRLDNSPAYRMAGLMSQHSQYQNLEKARS